VKLVLSTLRLGQPGGSETYALTLAEHLARLGHSVTLYARELGLVSEQARERALHVVATPEELPDEADGVIAGVDQGLGLQLVGRYPRAARVWVVHSSEGVYLQPPVTGAFAATVALNDLHAKRAAASACAGEVVRMRQPIDLRRFGVRGTIHERPQEVLLLGNYHSRLDSRAQMLREAWADAQIRWSEAGGPTPTLDAATTIAQADIVVGFGRSIIEAMACGRAAYVHDQAGSEGWVTPRNYERMEAGGFAVAGARLPPDKKRLRADLEEYDPALGLEGRDLVRTHHDARDHAAALVELIERIGPSKPLGEPSTLRALEQLAESQLRAELMAEHFRYEAKRWFGYLQHAQSELQHVQGELAREREALKETRGTLDHGRGELERERDGAASAAAQAREQLELFKRTRRYRMAEALARPLDRLRGALGR
jgi:hypothetical protein